MTRSKLFAGLACAAILAFGASVLLAADDKSLAEKVAALEAKVAELERRIETMGPPSPAMENEARAALGQINSMMQRGDYESAQKQMDAFKQKYSRTQSYKQAMRLDQELSVFGKPAPASWGVDKWFQGESDVDLGSDKPTLLVFWEVWCPHCKREVPKMQAMYDKYKSDGLQMVGFTKLTRNVTEDGVSQFIDSEGVKYPIAKENGTISSYFNVSGIPAAAMVKDGKVVWRGHPARLSETMLEGWL